LKIVLYKNNHTKPFSVHCDPRDLVIHDAANTVDVYDSKVTSKKSCRIISDELKWIYCNGQREVGVILRVEGVMP